MPLPGIYASQISGHLFTPSGAYDALASVTLSASASSITFAGIPTGYKHLQVRLIGRTSRGDYTIEDANLQINNDSGANYSWHRLYSNPNVPNNTVVAAAGVSATYINSVAILSTSTATSGMFGASIIDILDYASTTKYKTVRSFTGTDNNSDANGTGVSGFMELSSGTWLNTSAITSLTFTNTTGGSYLTNTQFALYGVK